MFNKLVRGLLAVLFSVPYISFAQQITPNDSVKGASDIFRKEIDKIALSLMTPDEQYPVSVNSILVKDINSDFMAVVIKAKIAAGWHIYASLPATHHYIVTDFILELPSSVEKIGEWIKPISKESAKEKGVYIYEREVVFVHYLKATARGNTESIIQTGLDYQCCDSTMCNPPQTKLFKLAISK